jgi:tRNA threonylcarbamoyladenosine biosynthesis protein TsaE
MKQEFYAATLAELEPIAERVKELLKKHPIAIFRGEMGSGKTTFIKKIGEAMGITEEISSPTFALVNEYPLPDGDICYHFDLHRLKTADELLDIGFEEYIYSGKKCLIEWPELAEAYLPDNKIDIHIAIADQRRKFDIYTPD